MLPSQQKGPLSKWEVCGPYSLSHILGALAEHSRAQMWHPGGS